MGGVAGDMAYPGAAIKGKRHKQYTVVHKFAGVPHGNASCAIVLRDLAKP